MATLTDEDLGVLLRETFAAHEPVASPERARSIATYAVSSPPSHPRRRVLLAAGAVAAVALSTTLVVQQRGAVQVVGGRTTSSTSSSPPRSTVVEETDAGHRAATVTAVRTALAAAPSLPGGHPATVDETGEIGNAIGDPAEHLVRQTRFALAPGTVDAAIAYLRNHPPAGYASGGWGSGGDRNAQFVDYEPASLAAEETDAFGSLRLTVTVVPQGDGVAARTDADAMWRPARLAATRLPADAQLTRITVSRIPIDARFGDAVLREVTVTPRLQAAVTAAVAALRPAIPGYVASCPAPTVRASDVFTFVSGQGTYVVTTDLVCMGSVRVAHDGIAGAQVLGRAADLDDLVKSAPGSPIR